MIYTAARFLRRRNEANTFDKEQCNNYDHENYSQENTQPPLRLVSGPARVTAVRAGCSRDSRGAGELEPGFKQAGSARRRHARLGGHDAHVETYNGGACLSGQHVSLGARTQ